MLSVLFLRFLLRCFRDKIEQKAFARNFDSLEHTDKTIQKEVKLVIKAEKHTEKLVRDRV